MTRILRISGSLRAGSYNTALLRFLGAPVWSGSRLLVSRASKVFDAQGEIADAAISAQLREFTLGFASFAAERRPGGAG